MKMTAETKQALLAELLCLADSEWVLGHWYAKITLNGRSVPDFTSMAAMAQDELGHTRALFRFLEQAYELPEYQLEFGRDVDEIHSMQLLDESPTSWADFVVTAYLSEYALLSAMETFAEGNFAPAATMLTKFAEEGYFHRLYIEGWLDALDSDERKAASAAFAKRLPLARAWFSPGSSDDLVAAEGVRTSGWADAEAGFRAHISDVLESFEVSWSPTLSQQNWDGRRRRPKGSAMPARLWEYIVPTTPEAQMARRPLEVSVDDNIDLFDKPKKLDGTEPFFERLG